MRNIMIKIEYDGTNYNGWQIQPNGRTIQQEIMVALKNLTGENANINGSGRTDAKVHARGQVANFYTASSIPIERFPIAMNHFLPEDITILEAREVSNEFHARYWAKGKRYSYHLYNHPQRSALLRNYSYHIPYSLDLDKMKEAANIFIGAHDFKGFMSSGSNVKDTIRTIHAIKVNKENNSIWITFEGNGFLYNMVRIMVGTLVEVANHKRNLNTVKVALEEGDRRQAGHTAPPQGLFLDNVFYPLTH
ncbi:tRNA pseudouridine(38-40) synthase TruA [Natronincola ferrireducens]|uniref:tRNA pseudouridine synthase A n=1 Tax=Natronincola ferrireducens TaxID=393762 RepID=A0A1G9I1R8_9FIRM|nr:tRNA pseudouridine(38-40) synthase TruA [Natronincola ferrireducens]SDL18986.1 tRNA pseudouridine38-40 synthase [Natronincola ferrireducens]